LHPARADPGTPPDIGRRCRVRTAAVDVIRPTDVGDGASAALNRLHRLVRQPCEQPITQPPRYVVDKGRIEVSDCPESGQRQLASGACDRHAIDRSGKTLERRAGADPAAGTLR